MTGRFRLAAARAYDALTCAYPSDFRERHAPEMRLDYRDALDMCEAPAACLRCTAHSYIDLLTSIAIEWTRTDALRVYLRAVLVLAAIWLHVIVIAQSQWPDGPGLFAPFWACMAAAAAGLGMTLRFQRRGRATTLKLR